jgi:large conductance mechanosensitive channel
MIKAMNTMKRRLERAPAAPAVLSTKECPQCLSTIPIKATRCAHCCAEVK